MRIRRSLSQLVEVSFRFGGKRRVPGALLSGIDFFLLRLWLLGEIEATFKPGALVPRLYDFAWAASLPGTFSALCEGPGA